ncbi:helix-turn-helix domain-containing protein [Aeromicrobium sp. CTD01-1L150]|uniref:helix-turn-helix domain-containing protein n=1 Tax=Aeromicrobium sp. CTD01-1L150 TaxID=3341830 RepID=UPI0035C04840
MGELLRMPDRPSSPPAPEPLWREAVGEQLRRRRHEHRRTLGEVAERAGISTQYLSEIERGLKDPSSEILAAVTGALDLTLLDLTTVITRDLGSQRRTGAPQGPLALVV